MEWDGMEWNEIQIEPIQFTHYPWVTSTGYTNH